jgi:similar to stage IV sporulation protein
LPTVPLIEYFRSAYRVSVHINDAHLLLDLLITRDIPFHNQKTEENTFSLLLYTPHYREYVRIRGKRRYRNEIRHRLGFLMLTERYRKRIGLAVGFVLALLLLVFSSLFVWDITVEGAERIPEQTILKALEQRGLRLGAFIPSLDTEFSEDLLILDVDGLSFVSINRRGTVVKVEVREREKNTEIVDTQSPSNLIASVDGQIEALRITGGRITVKLGQTVKKGELLVSGVIDSVALGYRLVRARGEVLARTSLTYQAEVAYETEEKVYTGRFFSEKSIKIFSKTIKLFRKDSNSASSCDKIESERRIYLFGLIKLPILITETEYAEYEIIPKTLTQQEALAEAYRKLRELYEEDLADAEILGRYTSFEENETGIKLTQHIECIIDIAKEVKINQRNSLSP